METNILMESGTNELEVLEFTVGNNHYGINVAKIKEIVQYSPVTPVPNSHPCVEGIFMPRDLMITVVDLAKVIKAQTSPDITKDMFFIWLLMQLCRRILQSVRQTVVLQQVLSRLIISSL